MPPKPSPTHFLCIPLTGTQLARSLASFRTDVTSPQSFAVPEDAVRSLGTLHLTLGVMSLKDQTTDRAIEILRAIRPMELLARAKSPVPATSGTQAVVGESRSTRPSGADASLSITIRGLRAMHAEEKTSVLYAPPSDPEGVLQRFCEQVKKAFMDAELMIDDHRPLLLHATIINTIYVKGATRGKRRERLTLDARDIISRYTDHMWIEDMPVNKISLCRMGAKKVEGTDDEAYDVEEEKRF